jgi:probable phosphoglycerate mutase
LGDTTSHVFASPRVRAVETAHLVLPDAHVIVDPLLSEFDYGDYEGLTSAQVTNDRPGWSIWDDGCPGGETVSHVGARAIEFMTANVGSLNGATLVVVTHGHFSRILAATTVGLSGDQGRRFASATASVSVIEDHHGERCISLWNLTASTVSGHVTDRRHDAQH